MRLPVIFFFFSFFFSFFCQPCPELRKCKSVFLILKISQHGGSRRWVQLFPTYPCPNWYKNWYLHFHMTYDHQIWQTGISRGVHWNETNEAGAGDVITSRSNLKHYISTIRVSGYQTWQNGNVPWGVPAHKVTWSFAHVVLWDHMRH